MIRITHAVEGTFVLLDGEQPVGGARAVFGDELTLLSVDAPDAVFAEGLVRAVLNAGRERGLKRAVCHEPTLFELLDRLEFSVAEEGRAVDIPAFFARGCRHE